MTARPHLRFTNLPVRVILQILLLTWTLIPAFGRKLNRVVMHQYLPPSPNGSYLILNTMALPSFCFSFFARPRATIVYSAFSGEKLSPNRSGRRPFWINIWLVTRCPLNRREITLRLDSVPHDYLETPRDRRDCPRKRSTLASRLRLGLRTEASVTKILFSLLLPRSSPTPPGLEALARPFFHNS